MQQLNNRLELREKRRISLNIYHMPKIPKEEVCGELSYVYLIGDLPDYCTQQKFFQIDTKRWEVVPYVGNNEQLLSMTETCPHLKRAVQWANKRIGKVNENNEKVVTAIQKAATSASPHKKRACNTKGEEKKVKKNKRYQSEVDNLEKQLRNFGFGDDSNEVEEEDDYNTLMEVEGMCPKPDNFVMKDHFQDSKAVEDLCCVKCEDVVQSPTRSGCCDQLFCLSCLNEVSACPRCKMTPFLGKRDQETETRVMQQLVFCPAGCGWLGKAEIFCQHYSYFCSGPYLEQKLHPVTETESSLERITQKAETVKQMILEARGELKNEDIISDEASNRVLDLVRRLADKVKLGEMATDEELEVLERAIQVEGKLSESLCNTVSDQSDFTGGIHLSFSVKHWIEIIQWILMFATAIFPDIDHINCCDFGAGCNTPSIVGTVLNTALRWSGIEIDFQRVRLGIYLFRIVQQAWFREFNRYLKPVGFMPGDCCQQINTRG